MGKCTRGLAYHYDIEMYYTIPLLGGGIVGGSLCELYEYG